MKLTLAVITMTVVCLSSAAQDITHVDANTPQDVQIRIAKLAAPKEITEFPQR
jgi:hypothetical protein